jgi:hypothetical protein
MRIIQPNPSAVTNARDAEHHLGALSEALRSLTQSPLTDATQGQLENALLKLDQMHVMRVLERALDELGAVPPERVDTDRVEVPHGVAVLWRGGDGRSTDQRLISRFMKAHPNVEVESRVGDLRDDFSITGPKADRQRFTQDPRLPRLMEALEDIYLAEHSPGYEKDRPARTIQNPMRYVFGS